jgi:hypothetical protein
LFQRISRNLEVLFPFSNKVPTILTHMYRSRVVSLC